MRACTRPRILAGARFLHRACFSLNAGNDWSVRRRIAIFPLVLAWVCANGAIWDVVQVFAWGKMFAGYTQTMSLGAALRETFEPSKACEMCSGIATAREAAKEQAPVVADRAAEKIILALDAPAPLLFDQDHADWPMIPAGDARVRAERVPVPPPRA